MDEVSDINPGQFYARAITRNACRDLSKIMPIEAVESDGSSGSDEHEFPNLREEDLDSLFHHAGSVEVESSVVSESLTKEEKDIISRVKRGRPSLTERHVEPPKKRVSNQVRPGHDIRFDEVGHWPEMRNSRNFCKNMGCTDRTNVACLKCNVNLCLNNRNNCFLAFHKK
ncbi:uncharacterized protein [Palaemon carinicauda]|uniref:uncharacterized protein n=1 Tax=Palaemon carinicauda TaxID=392227 RepID=UPI0035B644D4